MLQAGLAGLTDAKHDICVVGAGPVGLAVATQLVRRGHRVLLVESGKDGADATIQSLSDAEVLSSERHDDMAVAVSRRLGGTSHFWGARCIPYDPIDFAPRDWVDASWPISYSDVAAYFAEAARVTASGDPVFVDPRPDLARSDDRFEMDHIERWANKQQAQSVHATMIDADPGLDVRTTVTLVGIERGESGRVDWITVADSLTGKTIVLPIRRLILAAGGVETARLLLSVQRVSPHLFGGLDGPLGRYYMGHVSGEIADIVFDDPASSRAFDYHIDSNGSYVRRRIVLSARLQREQRLLNTAFWPVVPPIFDPDHDSAILSMVYLAMRWPRFGTMLVAEAIRKQHAPEPAPALLPHLKNLVKGAPGAALFGIDFLRRRYDREHRMPGFFIHNSKKRYGLSYHGEQLPHADSRITLGAGEDRLGLPTAVIDYRFLDADIESVVRSHVFLDDWLRQTGIGRLEYRARPDERAASVWKQANHGRHQIGLTRMGSNRRDAVVDRNLACFDIPNLYVASCSVLPTSSQANPTFTAVALAVRLAEHISNDAE